MLSQRKDAVLLISEALTDGSRVIPACKTLGISQQTFRAWRKNSEKPDGRKGPLKEPAHKLPQAERKAIVDIMLSEKYRDLTPDKIVPALADEGVYLASESTFYRILREDKMLAHRSDVSPQKRHRPEPYIATGPNQVYSWDITYLKTAVQGVFLYMYLVMDIYSRKIVGWRIHQTESSEYAANLIESICIEEGVDKEQLVLHSDNGSPMKGATMLATLTKLGVMPSFSRPSVSNDNPYSESLFKTIKYCPEYPSDCFDGEEEAIKWMNWFDNWYNNVHLHSGIKFVTPASRHAGLDIEILTKRNLVYEIAMKKNPKRWSGKTRNWGHIAQVKLNPIPELNLEVMKMAA
jgi:putative transposase